jgi:hypothetical protein
MKILNSILNDLWRVISMFGIITLGSGGTFYFLKGTEDWLSSGFVLESLWWLGLLTGTITSVGLAIIQLWQSKDIVHIESKTKAIKEKE